MVTAGHGGVDAWPNYAARGSALHLSCRGRFFVSGHARERSHPHLVFGSLRVRTVRSVDLDENASYRDWPVKVG
jgi:hypothetical protein